MEEPTKSDIDAIFKRLKTIPANKTCFDCGAKIPTWASITYGVFVCIDCSARHRGLGVHLSFIRSTNLDTNWGWLQLRAMQVGGNANADAFFQQHGCQTKDTQQKYTSRAAQLYREKLHQLATKAMKQYGNKIFLDDNQKHDHASSANEKKEEDFFHEHTQKNIQTSWDVATTIPEKNNQNSDNNQETAQGPSVDLSVLNEDASNKTLDPKKTMIGQRRPVPTKKKGFGAQKIQADFKEIERNVEEQEKLREQQAFVELKSREEEAKKIEKQMAGLKFAYQDMDKQRKLEEEKLKQSNPKKAEQMERLGMGFGNRSGVSHSAMTDMQTIQQEGASSLRSTPFANQNRDNFDDFDIIDSFPRRKLDADIFKPKTTSKIVDPLDEWETFGDKSNNRNDVRANGNRSTSSNYSNSNTNSSNYNSYGNSVNSSTTSYSATTDKDALKRFSNAKSISSDQFFNRD